MITVGLTGNVASGKTTVADRWRERGVVVIDADRLGHDVLREDAEVRAALIEAFGKDILEPGGAIDRASLGECAFASPEDTGRLNAIVHPPLLARLARHLERARDEGRAIAVVDAALVFEFGLDRDMDINVLVTAPPEVRTERLRRRGMDEERIAQVMASQMPDDEKITACDVVIVNEGSIDAVRARADEALDAIETGTYDEGGHHG